MDQFDVHRTVGAQRSAVPYVVIVQSRRFERARRRIVVPLVRASEVEATEPTLNPSFDIEGSIVLLNPLQIVSMAIDRLGAHVTSLKHEGDRVIAAIDLVISRAWG